MIRATLRCDGRNCAEAVTALGVHDVDAHQSVVTEASRLGWAVAADRIDPHAPEGKDFCRGCRPRKGAP